MPNKEELKAKEKGDSQTNLKNITNKNNAKTKNKRQENLIFRKTKKKKKLFQRIIFTYPPKKTILKLKTREKFDNNILVSNKNSSLNYMIKKREMEEKNNMNKQIFDVVRVNSKEKDKLDNYELNNLEYDSALELDKRNFIQIYWSLLKREHLIIFTFITRDDHNIIFIKYSRFIFLLCTDMAMNVFFFSDETMHKMFLDYGKYNFIQQIPQITYSTIISKLIEIVLCYLSLTYKHYYQIKDCKKISKSSMIGIIKCIRIKLAFFFGFTTLMFIFYWYLISCFCSVYQNTQIAFIKDSLLSFLLGNLIPFVIYLVSSLFRIFSLKSVKYKLECFYNFSNIIPFF